MRIQALLCLTLLTTADNSFTGMLARADHLAKTARVITIYRVTNELQRDYDKFKNAPKIRRYPILKQRALKQKEARRALSLLTSRRTYFPPDEGWTCLFEPGYVITASAPEGEVTFVVCLKCGDVEIAFGNAPGELHSITGAAAPDLRAALTKLLP